MNIETVYRQIHMCYTETEDRLIGYILQKNFNKMSTRGSGWIASYLRKGVRICQTNNEKRIAAKLAKLYNRYMRTSEKMY